MADTFNVSFLSHESVTSLAVVVWRPLLVTLYHKLIIQSDGYDTRT